MTIARDGDQDEPVVGCDFGLVPNSFELTWSAGDSVDRGDAQRGQHTTLVVANVTEEHQSLHVNFHVRTGGHTIVRPGPTFDLPPNGEREIQFDPRAQGISPEDLLAAGSVSVSVSPTTRGHGLRHAVSPELRFHPEDDRWLFYDERAAQALHSGGDFTGDVMGSLPSSESPPISVAYGVVPLGVEEAYGESSDAESTNVRGSDDESEGV
ncbi:MAG: hypothetical protein V3W41_07475 [Planctomycetota bacterium]